jgi:nucleoside-diphosphate-sugar epimerase
MILLTGATGLLGMHVLYDLTQAGHQVRALYRNKSRIDRVNRLFEYYDSSNYKALIQKVEWYPCEIDDLVELEGAFQGIDRVIHCAAMVSFRNDDFKKLVQINRYGTANMVNLALKYKVQWFCHASSTAAVGKSPERDNLNIDEKSKWLEDVEVSGYAMSKYLSEKEVWRGVEEGLPAVMVNPCVIFGPGDWDESSLTIFRAVDRGLKFYAPGANAFVDVRDISKRILFLMEQNTVGERFLIVGENLSFQGMTTAIAKRLGKKAPNIAVPEWLMGFAWRLAAVFSFITRKPTALTKDATKSAFSTTSYSTAKMDAVYPRGYIALEDCIDNVVSYREFQREQKSDNSVIQ